jgi:hypothetical protein
MQPVHAHSKEMQNPEGARRGLESLVQSYSSPQPTFALTIAEPRSDEFWGSHQIFESPPLSFP